MPVVLVDTEVTGLYTIEGYFWHQALGAEPSYFSIYQNDDPGIFLISTLTGGGSPRIHTADNNFSYSPNPPNQQWFHWALSVSSGATPNAVRQFRNGSFIGGNLNYASGLPTGLCDVYIGSESNVNSKQFYGVFSNIVISEQFYDTSTGLATDLPRPIASDTLFYLWVDSGVPKDLMDSGRMLTVTTGANGSLTFGAEMPDGTFNKSSTETRSLNVFSPSVMQVPGLPTYAGNSAAWAAGLQVGGGLVYVTEAGYLRVVVEPQTAPIASANFITNYSSGSGYPTFTGAQSFAPSAQLIADQGIDPSGQPWTIVMKLSNGSNPSYVNVNFAVPYTNSILATEGSALNPIIYRLDIKDTPKVGNISITNTTTIPSSIYDGGDKYYLFRRLSGGQTLVTLYDTAFTEVWSTTITTVVPYTLSTALFNLYYPDAGGLVLKGFAIKQDETYGPQDLEQHLGLG